MYHLQEELIFIWIMLFIFLFYIRLDLSFKILFASQQNTECNWAKKLGSMYWRSGLRYSIENVCKIFAVFRHENVNFNNFSLQCLPLFKVYLCSKRLWFGLFCVGRLQQFSFNRNKVFIKQWKGNFSGDASALKLNLTS